MGERGIATEQFRQNGHHYPQETRVRGVSPLVGIDGINHPDQLALAVHRVYPDPGGPCIASREDRQFLASHLIDPAVLREDRFAEFMADRQSKLVALIEDATGKRVIADDRE